MDTDGWTASSVKAGVSYAQPPQEIIRKTVALLLNLDDCLDEDGPLRVLPGSHLLRRLKQDEVASEAAQFQEQLVTGMKGKAILMSLLLIHTSSRTISASRRRVLHLEFANFELPGTLRWHRQIPCSPRGDVTGT